MGVYLDGDRTSAMPDFETLRQQAVDRARPLRLRGSSELEETVQEAARCYDAAVSAISIIDRDSQVFVARAGLDLWGTSREDSFCAVAIQRPGEPLVVPDARSDPRFSGKASVLLPPHIRFYAGITIVDSFGYALGALCVFDDRPRFEDTDLTLLTALARGVERVICR